ncbi:MAG: hypothetical protein LBV44_09340, partial [Methylobacillus sp.]|nr:hypothetical protein [Methylobacillus sp.]
MLNFHRPFFVLFLLFVSGAAWGDDASVVHWQHAERASETAAFAPPATPPDTLVWTPVNLPDSSPRSASLPTATTSAQADVVWWRLTVPESARAGKDVHLYLPRWQTVGIVSVYADDKLIYRTRGSEIWNGFNNPLWLPLTQDDESAAPGVILIRMASAKGIGGALSTVWVGSADALKWRYRARHFIQVDLVIWSGVAFLAIGVFSLMVWWVRRREKIYLVFFLIAALYVVRYLHMGIGSALPSYIPDDWFGWMTINALGWMNLGVFSFLLRISGRTCPRLEESLIVVGILVTVATMPGIASLLLSPEMAPVIYGASWALRLMLVIIGLWAVWGNQSRMVWALALLSALMLPIGLHDIALVSYRVNIENVYLMPYTGIGLLAISMTIIVRRYIDSLITVENVSTDLAQRVAEREAELSESYRQLHRLEKQHMLEEERQRIMRDMHDGMGSSLVSALRAVERGAMEPAEIAQVLRDCIDDLKLHIDSLSLAEPDLLAILATLRARLEPRFQRGGIELRWNVADVPELPWLDVQSALHILRILQEVLTNILKHTQATRIEFVTAADERNVLVQVRDNGGIH